MNQPPTGYGKKQSRSQGSPLKLRKRSEVVQAQRDHPELNLQESEAEAAWRSGAELHPRRPKAGR